MKSIKVKSQVRWLVWIMVIIYLLFICYFGFFSKIAGRNSVHTNEYNLVPFRTISSYINYKKFKNIIPVVVNIIGNMVVFMPFGIILRIILPKRNHDYYIYWVIIGSLLFSLAIEIIQYLMSVGVFDVDDLILNTTGSLVGYFVYVNLRKKYKRQ